MKSITALCIKDKLHLTIFWWLQWTSKIAKFWSYQGHLKWKWKTDSQKLLMEGQTYVPMCPALAGTPAHQANLGALTGRGKVKPNAIHFQFDSNSRHFKVWFSKSLTHYLDFVFSKETVKSSHPLKYAYFSTITLPKRWWKHTYFSHQFLHLYNGNAANWFP